MPMQAANSPRWPLAGTSRADWGAAHVNPDAALLWTSLAVPVLLRLMQLQPLTQTQAQQVLGASVRNGSAEGREGEQCLIEAAGVASALEHVSAIGRPTLQRLPERRSDLEVPRSHCIRLATALTQQVSSCSGGPSFPLHQAGNSRDGALRRKCQALTCTGRQQLLLLWDSGSLKTICTVSGSLTAAWIISASMAHADSRGLPTFSDADVRLWHQGPARRASRPGPAARLSSLLVRSQ